jgi:hypothetical protein
MTRSVRKDVSHTTVKRTIHFDLGPFLLVFLAFLILKLCGVIDWSWWWVLSPLWLMPVVLVSMILVYILLHAFMRKR